MALNTCNYAGCYHSVTFKNVFFELHGLENGFLVCIINAMGVGGKGSWGDKEIRDKREKITCLLE